MLGAEDAFPRSMTFTFGTSIVSLSESDRLIEAVFARGIFVLQKEKPASHSVARALFYPFNPGTVLRVWQSTAHSLPLPPRRELYLYA